VVLTLPDIVAARPHAYLSFPKIISGHTDEAGRTEWAWRQWFRIAGPPAAVAHPCPMINACGSTFSDAPVSGSKSFRPLVYFERSRMSGMFEPDARVSIPTGGWQSNAFDHRVDRGNDNQREYGR
jgi:hypothetical protein